jgi:hypothetical protein
MVRLSLELVLLTLDANQARLKRGHRVAQGFAKPSGNPARLPFSHRGTFAELVATLSYHCVKGINPMESD